jgi:predicted RecB family endonuclease
MVMKTIKDLRIGDIVFIIREGTTDIKAIEKSYVSSLKGGYIGLSNSRYSDERNKDNDKIALKPDQNLFLDQYRYINFLQEEYAINAIIANIKKAIRSHLANMAKQVTILTDYELAYTAAIEALNIIDKPIDNAF